MKSGLGVSVFLTGDQYQLDRITDRCQTVGYLDFQYLKVVSALLCSSTDKAAPSKLLIETKTLILGYWPFQSLYCCVQNVGALPFSPLKSGPCIIILEFVYHHSGVRVRV